MFFSKEEKVIYTHLSQLKYPCGDNIHINKEIIIELAKVFTQIDEFKGQDLNLICRGSLGSIVAAIFAMILPNKIIITHIKKNGEDSHGVSLGFMKEGAKNIIVDDFISTGETMNEIYKQLRYKKPNIKIDCVCVTGQYHKLDFTPKYFICSTK